MNLFKNITNKLLEITNDDNVTSIQINGKNYVGNNITITKDKVIIDGVVQDDNISDVKKIDIVINGNVKSVDTTCGNVNVIGNSGKVTTTSGDVTISSNVNGDVTSTSGDVEIKGDVSGDVKTVSGDVKCYSIGGSVKTVSGDIIGNRR